MSRRDRQGLVTERTSGSQSPTSQQVRIIVMTVRIDMTVITVRTNRTVRAHRTVGTVMAVRTAWTVRTVDS